MSTEINPLWGQKRTEKGAREFIVPAGPTGYNTPEARIYRRGSRTGDADTT